MTSDVVLTSAMRNNLLSLKGTQSLIDITQQHLSTGKKINSALDGPQSFFASQSLTNRAGDLNKLLDGIGQSIEVIKAADNGVTALTSLVNQAQAVAQSAQTAATNSSATASATGSVSLTNDTVLTSLSGVTTSGTLVISATNADGSASLLDGTSTHGLISITTGETVGQLISAINALNQTGGTSNAALATPTIKASLDSNGGLKLENINGGNLKVGFSVTSGTTANNQSLATGLGFGSIATTNGVGDNTAAQKAVNFVALASSALTTKGLYLSGGTIAAASSKLADLQDASGTALTTFEVGDTLKITINGAQSGDLLTYNSGTATTQTIQGVVDAINHDGNIGKLVNASFDSTTGKITIAAKDPSADDIQFNLANKSSGAAVDAKINIFQNYNIDSGLSTSLGAANVDFRFGAASGQLASLQTQYNGILDQIDSLVTNGDTAYQGTNLLNGDNLVTTFNETRTSSLTSHGTKFSSAGLGLSDANFNNADNINSTLDKLNASLTSIRSFSASLASDLSVIQTRQTFVNSTITTLKEGSDALVNADQNTESATLLALQTRQSLGVSALSLASQSAQSVLRLFQ